MKKFKTVSIFYFSGTGNAQKIASWFAEAASTRGIRSCISNIDLSDGYSSQNYMDSNMLLVFISPVHGFNYPKIMLNFIRRFPKGDNQVVLMNTRAGIRIGKTVLPGLTGITFLLSSLILISKGYRIVGQIPFDMPSNWISLHPALGKKSVELIYSKNILLVKRYFESLYSGNLVFISFKDIIQDLLIAPVALAYYFVGRYFFAKSFYSTTRCNQCNICVEKCPVRAIKMVHGRPFWSLKCESCMRCMNNCPVRAIETTHGLWFIFFPLTIALTSFFYNLLFGEVYLHSIIRFILFNILFMVLLILSYRLHHWLLGTKTINRLISFTSFTHYRFWGRYKAPSEYKKNVD